ncbi:MAG: hypothetical protein QG656_417, partial [Candidatus Hydrogenedentes bacterium]|nr:hypothetical protein [Candidatus Hydrogenedentota bacterium]
MSRVSPSLLVVTLILSATIFAGCPWLFPPGPDKTGEQVKPSAAFSADPKTGTVPLRVQFTDQSAPGSSPISKWEWTFGDGLRSSERNPSHVYNFPGLFTVSLTVTTALGSDTRTIQAFILAEGVTTKPKAAFDVSALSGSVPLSVMFSDQSEPGTSDITTWAWTFGDGATSAEQNPTHVYNVTGVFTVSLTVTSADGSDTITKTDLITVVVMPEVDFTASVDGVEGDPGLEIAEDTEVQFRDTSTAGSAPTTAWLWNFGDGTPTSVKQNPLHEYTQWGVYDVSLTVTTADGSVTETKTGLIEVFALPEADFTASTTQPLVGANVTFTDRSIAGSEPIASWLWDFGDGAQSTGQNPKHAYAVSGTYTVSLTVTSELGEDTETKETFITVMAPPKADFEAAPLVARVNTAVTFTDRSTPGSGRITSWVWNFGDGKTSNESQPQHAYATDGIYTVSLTVKTQYGTSTETKKDYIEVVVFPIAKFSIDKRTPNVGETVSFKDESTVSVGSITAWSWTFGDGATSTQQNPTHAYTAVGAYLVTLTVTAGSASASAESSVTVIQLPNADFSAHLLRPLPGTVVLFTDRSSAGSSPISERLWEFGDGVTSNEINPSHAYTSVGFYTVKLTVKTGVGQDTEEKLSYITVVEPLGAEFTVENVGVEQTEVIVGTGDTVRFTNLSSPGQADPATATWEWFFGDGTPANSEVSPSHQYVNTGTYTVSLRITVPNPSGTGTLQAARTRPAYIRVIAPPVAAFVALPTQANEGQTVQFYSQSTPGAGSIVSYLWNFGDGTTSTVQQPSHAYAAGGRYTVSLTVENTYTLRDTETKIDFITVNLPPQADFSADDTAPWIRTQTVNFTNLTDGGSLQDYFPDTWKQQMQWAWTFGDGASSTAFEPTHIYQNEGVYTVTLTATCAYGSDIVTKTAYINATIEPPTVEFSVSDRTPAISDTVRFTDLSTGGLAEIVGWQWDFGDETSSFERHPYHSYATQGVFNVTLTLSIELDGQPVASTPSLTKSGYITVALDPPTADFSMSNSAPFMWETVNFTDLSDPGTGPLLSWAWDFGDGTTSNAQNPFHLYYTPGVYTITLTVTTPSGTSHASKQLMVLLVYPEINYGVDKNVVLAGLDDVTFSDYSTINGGAEIRHRNWYTWSREVAMMGGYAWGSTYPPGPAQGDIFEYYTVGHQQTYIAEPADGEFYPFWETGKHHALLEVLGSSLIDPGNPYDPDNTSHWTGDEKYSEDIIEVREPGPLDRYVHPSHAAYFPPVKTNTVIQNGYKAYVLDFKSLEWAIGDYIPTIDFEWRHWLVIFVPDNITNDTALLFLDDGTRNDPAQIRDDLGAFAVQSGSIVVDLQGTMNQPIEFFE